MLKTDDEAFVNVPPLLGELRSLCKGGAGGDGSSCWQGGLYVGSKAQSPGGSKFRNEGFPFNTGEGSLGSLGCHRDRLPAPRWVRAPGPWSRGRVCTQSRCPIIA